jgi:hypothetical protein
LELKRDQRIEKGETERIEKGEGWLGRRRWKRSEVKKNQKCRGRRG